MTLSSSKISCGDERKKEQTSSTVPNARDTSTTGTEFTNHMFKAQEDQSM
jgi:hypothetical protein